MRDLFAIVRTIGVVLMLAGLPVGCGSDEAPPAKPAVSPPSESKPPTQTDAVDDLKSGLSKAFDAAKRLAEEKRETVMEKVDDKLKEFDTDLVEMQTKAGELEQESRDRWQELEPQLQEKRDAVMAKLKEIKEAGPKKWMELANDLDKTWAEMAEVLSKAKKIFDSE